MGYNKANPTNRREPLPPLELELEREHSVGYLFAVWNSISTEKVLQK
jgi:hypothetical protein